MHQFTLEWAVLQSAFELADKTYPVGLQRYTKSVCCEKTLKIIKVAIDEVCEGLHQPCTPEQRCHWRLKVISVIAAALLRDGVFCLAGARMPEINWSLFFELVKQCGCSQTFTQLLDLLPNKPATRLLHELFKYTHDAPMDESNAHLVARTVVHLLAHQNYIIFRVESSPSVKLAETSQCPISSFLHCMSTVVTMISESDRALLFVALVNLYRAGVSGHCIVKEHVESINLVDVSPNLPSLSQIHKEVTNVLNSFFNDVDIKVISKCLSMDLSDRQWAQAVLRRTYSSLSESDSKTTETDTEAVSGRLMQVLESVLQNVDARKTADDVTTVIGDTDKLSKALFVIGERLLGYEELCEWMATTEELDIILDKRWLQCLQSNIDVFSQRCHFLRLCDRVIQLVSTHTTKHMDVICKLKQVLLEIFHRLPAAVCRCILSEMYTCYNIENLFDIDGKTFQQTLLTTFNQLVNLSTDFPQIFRTVAILALQCPAHVLHKLVSGAIENSGQVELLAKLIQELASVAELSTESGPSMLCDTFEDILLQRQFTTQESANLKILVSLLLKPYSSNLYPDYKNARKPILNAGEFLEICILPYIHRTPYIEELEPALLFTALSLLRATMDTLLAMAPDWWVSFDTLCHPLAIAVCLCGLIDSCQKFDDDADWRETKDAAISALNVLVALLQRHQSQITEKSLCWLYDKLQQFDWTISLHLHPLMSSSSLNFPRLLPAPLCKLLRLSNTHHWKEMHTDTNKIPLLWLFELCRTTDESLNFAKENICRDTLCHQPDVYNSVITILVQILQYSTGAEQDRLFEFVHYLIHDSLLIIPDEIEPAAESPAIAHIEMRFSHVLRDVLQLSALSYKSTVTLQHLCQTYVTAIQKYCIQGLLEDSLQTLVTTTLTVIFRDVTLCTRSLPIHIADQLTVLILQIASGCATILRQVDVNGSGEGQIASVSSGTLQQCRNQLKETAGLLNDLTTRKTVLRTLL